MDGCYHCVWQDDDDEDDENEDDDEEEEEEDEEEGKTTGTGGVYTMEQCVAAVREKARQRAGTSLPSGASSSSLSQSNSSSAADLTTIASLSTTTSLIDPDAQQLVRQQQALVLESRRLSNELASKRANKKYQDLLQTREKLPAYQLKDTLIEAISKNRVVVISGDTGCGKTTQVPQLVLDYAIDQGVGGGVNIVVTQPRRISAVSVAERIAQERVEVCGQTAGFHIKLESKKSAKTRILLMTTGRWVIVGQGMAEGGLVDQLSTCTTNASS